jgi:hypothetical protein
LTPLFFLGKIYEKNALSMSKKSFKNKKNDEWEYDDTPEIRAAIAKLHEDIRQRKLKEQDDKFGYDTSGK